MTYAETRVAEMHIEKIINDLRKKYPNTFIKVEVNHTDKGVEVRIFNRPSQQL